MAGRIQPPPTKDPLIVGKDLARSWVRWFDLARTALNASLAVVTGAAAGNVATFDSAGSVQDGGAALSALARRASGHTTGNLASLDADGDPADSGKKVADFLLASAGADGSATVITQLRVNGGILEYKNRSITVTDGQITAIGAESAWAQV